jgi:hypothetical protein
VNDRRQHTAEVQRLTKSKPRAKSAPGESLWTEWKENDRQEQNKQAESERLVEDQLAKVRGLVKYAIAITAHWCLDHSSARKKKANVFELQDRLGELSNILSRQSHSLKDGQRWSATVVGVSSLSKIIGIRELATVVDQLPQELPRSMIVPLVTRTVAENLRRLCAECGWTPYRLHKETGVDKKLVLGHMRGKGCSLGTLKTYADAFSKSLGRPISPDLES